MYPLVPQIVGNRVVFGSGVTIGAGTVLLPSAYMAPEAEVGDGRIVGALATSMHPTRRNRFDDYVHRLCEREDNVFIFYLFIYYLFIYSRIYLFIYVLIYLEPLFVCVLMYCFCSFSCLINLSFRLFIWMQGDNAGC